MNGVREPLRWLWKVPITRCILGRGNSCESASFNRGAWSVTFNTDTHMTPHEKTASAAELKIAERGLRDPTGLLYLDIYINFSAANRSGTLVSLDI